MPEVKGKLCHILMGLAVVSASCSPPASAQSRVIARVNGGSEEANSICVVLGCAVTESIGDPQGQVFLLTSRNLNTQTFITDLSDLAAVIDSEPDLLAKSADASYSVPSALTDSTPVNYFGQTLPEGYVSQPAISIVRLGAAQNAFGVVGAGTVSVIDTGVDPTHPALRGVLLPGYDFTRNQNGADERADLTLTTSPTPGPPAFVNPNAAANLDQSTAAVVDGNGFYSDFGHGTMVAGIVHLVAPGAMILPFKVFQANGTDYTSDILRAIYRSVQSGANVINMSFNLNAYSTEIKNAISYANGQNVICVAAAGNDGEQTTVYPAGLQIW